MAGNGRVNKKVVDGWMDGWMVGWMDGWMDGWMEKSINGKRKNG